MRALFLGVLASGLAACASSPAPIEAAWTHPLPRPPVSTPEYFTPQDGDGVDPYNPPHIVPGADPEQCVPFARDASGIQIYGDANTWWTQADGHYVRSSVPAVGSVLVMRGYYDDTRGHVAVVAAIVSPRIIRVDQANWLNQGEISLSVPVVDVSPNNDWSEVRVWYIPDNHWGGRVYPASGFIHPFALVPSS